MHSSQLIVAEWHHVVSNSFVDIGTGNGLLPDGNKPLPEAMLTNHPWYFVASFEGNFTRNKQDISPWYVFINC